ncbi:MAG: response regulator transcription factor [Gammaproteobacteria bacterium]|nr:response regulator transcription factor [Gammaproteobacteria bacterium]
MRILIVDDEPLARARLRAQLGDLARGTVVGEAGNGIEALRLAQELRPDLVLLDIRMPGMDGIETARHLARLHDGPAVIFTTAYDAHALAAFEARAIDYLLKPIRTERLREALDRVALRSRGPAPDPEGMSTARTHLSAWSKGRLVLVAVDEIRCLCADQRYVRAVWPEGELLLDESLRTLEEELGDRFLRAHRTALVAVRYVRCLEPDGAGGNHLLLDGVAEVVPVSRRVLADVRRRLRG